MSCSRWVLTYRKQLRPNFRTKTLSNYYILPKLAVIPYRLYDYVRLFPWRIYRLFKYTFRGIWNLRFLFGERGGRYLFDRPFHKIGYWLTEVFICFLEIFGLPEIYETITDFAKPSTRPLHDWEISMAREIFGNAINYQRVRVDESAYLGPRQQLFCYASFYIINSWGPMKNSTLIHELVHIWQYENMGAVYIPRALWAQTTDVGYNYGGLDQIKLSLLQNETLYDFNLEQQGDIISDYFLLKNGYPPQWGKATVHDLHLYEQLIFGKLDQALKT